MKKYLVFLGVLLFVSSISFAQTTTVSATVTDSDSTLWTNGTVTVQFVPNPANPSLSAYKLCNGSGALNPAVLSQGPLTLDGTGAFTVTTYDNNQVCPSGSQWQFTVCPLSTSKCGIVTTITTGVSQNITSLVDATIPAPRFPATIGNYGYADIEAVLQLTPGSVYYNVNSSCYRVYSGSFWGCSPSEIPTPVSVANGGTGATTAAGALANLGGVSQIIAGTNVTISPSGGTGPVTISSTGGGGSGVQYNPSTTVYYMASSSILMNDGYSFSPGTTVGTWSCSGTTCTFNTTSAHGYTTGDYVDVSQVTGWIPDFESTRQWRTNVDIFQVTVTGTTQFTVTTSTTSTFGGSGGTSYLATYWGAYQTADQPYFKGHGTFISFFSTAQNLATNFSSEVTCSAGTPSYLILQVGANDVISNGASAATVEGYLQSIWQQAHAAGCIVVEMPILNTYLGISEEASFWITIGQIDQWIGGQGITDAGLSAGQYWDRYVGFNGSTSGIVGTNASGSIIFASHVNEAFSTQSSSWDGNGAWQAWANETGAYWIPGQLTMIDPLAPGGPAPAIQIQTDLNYEGTPNNSTRMVLTSYGGNDGLDQTLNPGLGQSGCSELDIARRQANQSFRVCANNVDNGSGGNDFYSIEGWTGSIWLKGIEVLTHGGLVFPQLLASSGTQPLVVDTAGNVSVANGGSGFNCVRTSMTGTYVTGTTYTNSTGATVFEEVTMAGPGAGASGEDFLLSSTINGAQGPSAGITNDSWGYAHIGFWVPAGGTFSATVSSPNGHTGETISQWTEVSFAL